MHDPSFHTIQLAILRLNNFKHHLPLCLVLFNLSISFFNLFCLYLQFSLKHFDLCYPFIPFLLTSLLISLIISLYTTRILDDFIETRPRCTYKMGDLLLYFYHYYFLNRPVYINCFDPYLSILPLSGLEIREHMIGVHHHFSVFSKKLKLFLILQNCSFSLPQQLLHSLLLIQFPCLCLLQPLNFPFKCFCIILLFRSLHLSPGNFIHQFVYSIPCCMQLLLNFIFNSQILLNYSDFLDDLHIFSFPLWDYLSLQLFQLFSERVFTGTVQLIATLQTIYSVAQFAYFTLEALYLLLCCPHAVAILQPIQIQYLHMRLFVVLLFSYALCSYIPELAVSASADFLNRQISANYGVNISRKINQAKINNTEFDQVVSGVRVHGRIANIVQNVTINWKANFLNVTDPHTFIIHSKNINVTIMADLNITVGLTPKQSGPLSITITKMTVNTTLNFKASSCGGGGLGFDVQIKAIEGNSDTFEIKIEGKGKGLDNQIIQVLEKIIRPRVPKILTNLALNQINPLITNTTCANVYDTFALGNQTYYVTGNTTQVPEFVGNDLFLPVDIILTNIRTNSTNDEVTNDYLPQIQISPNVDALFTASSNMINTLIWLIEDSFVLHKVITNEMLGPSPPIVLNTTNLTILMPKLKQWPNKAMLLIVSPASRVSQIFIRGGRLMGALSMSVRFIVNNTGNIPDVYTCLSRGACIQACDLNITISMSLALMLESNNAKGLLHSLSIASIKIIQTAIDLNVKTLNSILSSIVSSSIPSVNDQLRAGIMLNITNLTKSYGVTKISSRTSLDYLRAELQFNV